jgi:hypothetical protein
MSSGMIKRIVIPKRRNLSYVSANQRWRSWSSERHSGTISASCIYCMTEQCPMYNDVMTASMYNYPKSDILHCRPIPSGTFFDKHLPI